jgi:hypothetical protein
MVRLSNEMKTIWKLALLAYWEYNPVILPRQAEKNHEKPQSR